MNIIYFQMIDPVVLILCLRASSLGPNNHITDWVFSEQQGLADQDSATEWFVNN